MYRDTLAMKLFKVPFEILKAMGKYFREHGEHKILIFPQALISLPINSGRV